MKSIDRLIIMAKKKCGVDCLEAGFIFPSETDPGKWIARGDVWNGIPGGDISSVSCLCNSIQEAEVSLQALSEKYPHNKNIVIFIEDIAE